MTRQNLISNIHRYLEACDSGLDDFPLSDLGVARFRWLADTMLVPLFSHTRQQVAQAGVIAEQVVNLDHYLPYAMLWVKAPIRLVLLWPSERREWMNLSVCQDGTLTQATVSALSYDAISRGRLEQELHLALPYSLSSLS